MLRASELVSKRWRERKKGRKRCNDIAQNDESPNECSAALQSREREKSIPGAQYDIWVLTLIRIHTEMYATFAGLLVYTHHRCEHNQPYWIFPLHCSIRCGFEFDTNESGRMWKSNQRTREKVRKADRKWNSIYWNCGWIACHAFTNGVLFREPSSHEWNNRRDTRTKK